MDIDEFLDKEVQVEKKEESIAREVPEFKEEIRESVQANTPGEFELLEKRYFEFWEKISQEKLSWDSELYRGISSVGDDIKEKAAKFLLAVNSDKKTAKELVEKAKKELEKHNHEAALSLYSKVVEIRNSIPNAFFEDKAEINEHIFELYQAIHKQIDSKFRANLLSTIAKINSIINSAFSSIENNSLESSEKFYSEAVDYFKTLRHGFLLHKIELGNRLLALYKELSIHKQIKHLQEQLTSSRIKMRLKEAQIGNYKLRRLSEAMRPDQDLKSKYLSANFPKNRHNKDVKGILKKLVERKIERAKMSLEKGFYSDAKKNIEAILRLDPDNLEAKKMLIKIPQ